MKGIHSNINVRWLELYHPDTIEGRTKPPPPPVVISEDNIEFEVQKIIRHRINKDKNKTVNYLVKWKGLGPAEEQWLTAKDLKNSPDVLSAYHDKHLQLKPITKPKKTPKEKPQEKEATSEGEAVTKRGEGVRTENLDPSNQYKKTYEGPALIRPNLDSTHRMATRSNRSPRVVVCRAQRRNPNQCKGTDRVTHPGKGQVQEVLT